MDGSIQTFGGFPGGSLSRHAPAHSPTSPIPVLPAKTPGDFFRALRRRFWIVLIVATLVGIPGAIFVLRQPNIYRATATIKLEPPGFDPRVAAMFPHGGMAQSHESSNEHYVPNQITHLNGPWLAEKVVAQPSLGLNGSVSAGELTSGISYRRHPDSNVFDVYFEGRDPELVAKLLNELLREFSRQAQAESSSAITNSQIKAQASVDKYKQELATLDANIQTMLEETPIFAPGGRNRLDEEYVQLKGLLLQKQLRFDELVQQEQIARRFPILTSRGASASPVQQRIAELEEYKAQLTDRMAYFKDLMRDHRNDASTRHLRARLDRVNNELKELSAYPVESAADLSQMLILHSSEEVHKLELEVRELFDQMHATMPAFQQYLTILRDREQKAQSIATLQDRLEQFAMLAETQTPPVQTLQSASAPELPVRPNRSMNMALVMILGIGLGIGLVCLLEMIDHRVKVPEHLTHGLSLPLFGVVPRIRRMSTSHRGGHLWTPGIPASIEADAFRNLRASLLGVRGPSGRQLTTLLVTSAKAGEGKSTTALNLAATCAAAGERTLLVDVDLRRPSLGTVFRENGRPESGLVDVLRGDLPWQRAVLSTGIDNLDFLPTGDPAGVPIEILGTLELRQLLLALAGHYHRVILDGPAVLGLADCRMLGRMVDAALMVVRSGAHGLRPLHRAKSMLEQSKVVIAGVVFNGLDDDLSNWSCTGTEYAYGSSLGGATRAIPTTFEPTSNASTFPMTAGSLGA